VNDLSGTGISIYPNPVSDFLNISFVSPPSGTMTLNIYNALGALIWSEIITGSTQQIPWTFPAGAYGVEISGATGKYTTRVVKL
jgi:hypothetical protein